MSPVRCNAGVQLIASTNNILCERLGSYFVTVEFSGGDIMNYFHSRYQ